MTRQIVDKSVAEMPAVMRALVAYEPNSSLDLVEPQETVAQILRESPVVRSELGVASSEWMTW
jgi:hypothetical protein